MDTDSNIEGTIQEKGSARQGLSKSSDPAGGNPDAVDRDSTSKRRTSSKSSKRRTTTTSGETESLKKSLKNQIVRLQNKQFDKYKFQNIDYTAFSSILKDRPDIIVDEK